MISCYTVETFGPRGEFTGLRARYTSRTIVAASPDEAALIGNEWDPHADLVTVEPRPDLDPALYERPRTVWVNDIECRDLST